MAGGAGGPPTDPLPSRGHSHVSSRGAPWASASGTMLQPPPAPPVACAISAPRGLSQREMCSGGGGLLCSLPPPREQQLLLPPPGCRPVPSSGSCLCNARARPAPDSCAEAQGDARRVALGLSGRRGPPAPHVLAWRSGTKSRANWDCKCVYLLDLAGFFFFPRQKSHLTSYRVEQGSLTALCLKSFSEAPGPGLPGQRHTSGWLWSGREEPWVACPPGEGPHEAASCWACGPAAPGSQARGAPGGSSP